MTSVLTCFNPKERRKNSYKKEKNNNDLKFKIPDMFIKFLIKNKSKLLNDPSSKNNFKKLLKNKHIINRNYIEPKPNFYLGNPKYHLLERNNINLENNKMNSPLPKISPLKNLFNLRYKENPRDYEKYKNLGKELINIQSKYNYNIETESVIPNKNVNKFYFISKMKKTSYNEKMQNNAGLNNYSNKNSNNSEYDINKAKNKNYQNKTFASPFSPSMLSRNKKKTNNFNNNVDEMLVNELMTNYLYFKSNYSIKSQSSNINNSDNKTIIMNTNENEKFGSCKNIKKINRTNANSSNNTQYNYYHNNTGLAKQNSCHNNLYKIKNEINNDNNANNKLISVTENINNENNNIQTPQKKFYFKKKFKEYQLNLKSLQIFNSFSTTNNKLIKIRQLTKINPFILLMEFKNNYATQEEIQKEFSKKMISFPLNINISQNNTKEVFYYFINKMYRNQFAEYMKHRTNWELITKFNIDGQKTINFSWKYMSSRINFKNYKYEANKPCKKLRMVNLFERNYEVGNKKNMFINLINYCDKININAFNLVPFTVIINNTKDVDYYLEAIYEIVDFLNRNKNIKNNLITNRKYNEHFYFDKNFEGLNRQYININKNFLSNKNYWILKPTDLYQGKCIEICNSFEEINKKCRNMFKGVEKKFIPEIIKDEDLSEEENYQNHNISKININTDEEVNNINNNSLENKNSSINNNNNSNKKKITFSKMYCSNEIIIQKYLDKPLLYYKRKFDIRCFVLVDSNLNIFFCREGHLKGSSEFYDLNNTNKLIHITNYSLQKKSSKFEQYEDGNEISYNDFKKYMKEKDIPIDKFNYMINQMKYLVEISIKSVGTKLIKTNPVLCFEIFGYDFIIDNDFNPWILEINNNPGLCISSPVIQKLVPRMLDDAFRLTIDKVFETRYSPEVIDSNGNYMSKYKLDGYSDEENIFEFLCNVN